MRRGGVVLRTALVAFLGASALSAQEPPPPVTGDTLGAPLPGDTVPAADSLPPVVELFRMPAGPQAGWSTGVWALDREQLMSVRDLTLLELLERVPGLLTLRGGDYGAPESASTYAGAAGRVRLFWDGLEIPALDGGAPDLALIGLGGVETLKVERGPGELRIHVESLRASDPRPFSMVEAGTGDLDSNFFRGTFMHPRVLGGILGVALERVDTRGPFRREPGNRSGGWLSWGRPLGGHLGVRVEARQMARDVALAAFPVGLSRTDWTVRVRGRFLNETLTGELFSGSSTLASGEDEAIVPVRRSARQNGLRVAWEPGPGWISGSMRLSGGEGQPGSALSVEGGAEAGRLGGVYGRAESANWEERSTAALTFHAHTRSFLGLSAYGSYSNGEMGAPVYPAYDTLPAPGPGDPAAEPAPLAEGFTDQTVLRLGAAYQREGLRVQGGWMSLDVDSLPPLGLVLDRAGPTVPGGRFLGWEADLRLDLPVRGFALNGSVQIWDRETRYLPERSYQGAIEFHDIFMESGNLELWGALGVRGRSPMLVPARPQAADEGELARVPFQQSWYADLQVRVLTVNVFIRWDNFTLRQNLRDYPGRTLPFTRAVYGVRWTLWN